MTYLNGRTTGCQCKNKLVLLSGELGVDFSDGGALSDGLVNVSLGDGLRNSRLQNNY